MKLDIGIIGGGPASLFLFKRLLETDATHLTVDIFETSSRLGAGFPYSAAGANREHVTNVSGNEIPKLVTSVKDWIQSLPTDKLATYNITPDHFSDFKVMPRLLFGEYLETQFHLLLQKAKEQSVKVNIHFNSPVTDIEHEDLKKKVTVVTKDGKRQFDKVIIATGHNWPKKHEGKVPGYFDSPYPPSKLCIQVNHPVAVRGASLTAIDAVRTLARLHGQFTRVAPHKVVYNRDEKFPQFRIAMYSIHGLLPAVRFHLSDSHLSADNLLSKEEILEHLVENEGFLSLDYAFERNFKDQFRKKDPDFYEKIKELTMEEFVDKMMGYREEMDAFSLFKEEYDEATISIKRKKSIYWKEMLAILSFAMNYPAKHLSAEDMLRYKKTLMPLISIIIAFVPQTSCEELIALHEAGLLSLLGVGPESDVEITPNNEIQLYRKAENGAKETIVYKTFVDCIGQPALGISNFPFKSLVENGNLSQAKLKYRSAEEGKKAAVKNERVKEDASGNYFLEVPGVSITDNFKIIDSNNRVNHNIFMMAVPFIGGFNPDYSGLDFCEEASTHIVDAILDDVKVPA